MSSRSEAACVEWCADPLQRGCREVKWRYCMSQQADRSERTFSFSQPHLPSFSCRVATMSQFIWGQMAHSLQRLLVIVLHVFLSSVKEQKWHVGSVVWGDNRSTMHSVAAVLRCTWTKRLEMDPDDDAFSNTTESLLPYFKIIINWSNIF